MPPWSWFALAALFSASIGATIARAVGRAYRASSRPATAAHPASLREGATPSEPRASPSPDPSGLVAQVVTEAGPRAVNVRILADTGRPTELTVQRAYSDGSTSELYHTVLPAASALPREAPASARRHGAEGPRPIDDLRRTVGAWSPSISRFGLWNRLRHLPLETSLAIAAVVLYAVTRLWAIDSLPIFFYSDEVNYVLFGEQIYERWLVGEDGSWPAVYVLWDTNRWGPAVGVYLHGLAALILGKHVWVARSTEAIISLGGVVAIASILKDHFRSRFWWAVILFAAGIPAWFLYTRTAFSSTTAASLYAVFLLAYVHYRHRSPASLGLAAVAGAAAFYSYHNMMLVIGALVLCLLVSDFRYHSQHRRVWLRTLPILALLAVPLVEFRILHPEAIAANLNAVASYWVDDLPLCAKLLRFAQTYLQGLNPLYWFAPQQGTGTLPVQFIPGAGQLGFALLPFVGLGLFVVLRNLRSPRHRLVVLSALVVPIGSALDTIEISRLLAMVVPALLLAVLGLEQLGDWLRAVPRNIQTAAVAGALFLLALARFIGAMLNGPTWSTDYGLQGTQFGAKVLYEDTIPALLAEDPATTLVMNTTWANNAHIYPRFFLSPSDQERVRFGNVRDYLDRVLPLEPETIIAMTPEEYADALASPMLGKVDVVTIVYRPNGDPGFYFARIAYAADVESLVQDLEAIRVEPVESQVDILGQPTTVLHSRLADGDIANLFDGSTDTLVRGDDVNPFLVEICFPQPRELDGIRVTTGSFGDFSVSVTVTLPGSGEPLAVSQRYRDLGPDPTVTLSLPSVGAPISTLRLEVTDNAQGPTGVIHVREIALY